MKANLLASTFALILSLSIVPAAAAATIPVVNVELQDSAIDSGDATMHIRLDHDTIRAGQVKFRAVNQSKGLIHELIVVRIDPKTPALPYDDKQAAVVE